MTPSLFESLVLARPAPCAELGAGGALTVPQQVLIVHPATHANIPLHLVTHWFAVQADDTSLPQLCDLGSNWQLNAERAGLYPTYHSCAQAPLPVVAEEENRCLVGAVLPIASNCCTAEQAWSEMDFRWGPNLREGHRDHCLRDHPQAEHIFIFKDLDRAVHQIEVAGRTYAGYNTRSIHQLLVYYPTYALLLHSAHGDYLNEFEPWLEEMVYVLAEDDDGLEFIPYNYEHATMSRPARFSDRSDIPLHIFGLAGHPAARQIEHHIEAQVRLRGHVDLSTIDWDHFGPPYPREDSQRLWGAAALESSSLRGVGHDESGVAADNF